MCLLPDTPTKREKQSRKGGGGGQFNSHTTLLRDCTSLGELAGAAHCRQQTFMLSARCCDLIDCTVLSSEVPDASQNRECIVPREHARIRFYFFCMFLC